MQIILPGLNQLNYEMKNVYFLLHPTPHVGAFQHNVIFSSQFFNNPVARGQNADNEYLSFSFKVFNLIE